MTTHANPPGTVELPFLTRLFSYLGFGRKPIVHIVSVVTAPGTIDLVRPLCDGVGHLLL